MRGGSSRADSDQLFVKWSLSVRTSFNRGLVKHRKMIVLEGIVLVNISPGVQMVAHVAPVPELVQAR